MELPARLKEIGEILDMGISFGNAYKESMDDDGEITYGDAFNFINPLMKIEDAIEGGMDGLKEAYSASEEDQNLLKAYFKEKFDLADDEVEKRIEDAFVFVLALAVYLKTWFG